METVLNPMYVVATQVGLVKNVIKVYALLCKLACMHEQCKSSLLRITVSSCSIYAALCYPDCQNGGTCVFPGHCVCPTNTHGYRCQTILPV